MYNLERTVGCITKKNNSFERISKKISRLKFRKSGTHDLNLCAHVLFATNHL